MTLERVYETDVLVIGGGISGCFAAIRAKEDGLRVLMVDKGYAGKAGATPMASLGLMAVVTWQLGHAAMGNGS